MKRITNFIGLIFLLTLCSFTVNESLSFVDDFVFDGSLSYKMIYIDKKGNEQSFPYTIFFNEEREVFAIKVKVTEKNAPNETIIVYDKAGKKMHMLIDSKGEKTAMSMPFNPDQLDNTAEKMTSDDYSFEKTGNTKEILGYTCEEYKFKSDDGAGKAWITTEAGISGKQVTGLLGMGNKGKNKNPFMGAYPEGLMLESAGVTEKGEKYKMIATEVSLNSSITISTEGYTSMMNFGK